MSCIRWASVEDFQSPQSVVWSERVLRRLKTVACDLPQPRYPSPERIDVVAQPSESVGLTPGAGLLLSPLSGLGGVWNQSHPTVGRPVLCGPPQSNSSASFTGFSVPTLGPSQPGSSGAGGSLVSFPSKPVLSHQRLPVLPTRWSHQKSTPLGWWLPSGAMPMMLRV